MIADLKENAAEVAAAVDYCCSVVVVAAAVAAEAEPFSATSKKPF